jgi:hypothetical protein
MAGECCRGRENGRRFLGVAACASVRGLEAASCGVSAVPGRGWDVSLNEIEAKLAR